MRLRARLCVFACARASARVCPRVPVVGKSQLPPCPVLSCLACPSTLWHDGSRQYVFLKRSHGVCVCVLSVFRWMSRSTWLRLLLIPFHFLLRMPEMLLLHCHATCQPLVNYPSTLYVFARNTSPAVKLYTLAEGGKVVHEVCLCVCVCGGGGGFWNW